MIPRPFAASPTPFPPSSRRCLRSRCGIGPPATPDKDGAANSRTGSTRSTARQRGASIARRATGEARQSSRNPVLAVRRRALVLIGREGYGRYGATAGAHAVGRKDPEAVVRTVRGDAFAFSFQAALSRVKVLKMCDHFRAVTIYTVFRRFIKRLIQRRLLVCCPIDSFA